MGPSGPATPGKAPCRQRWGRGGSADETDFVVGHPDHLVCPELAPLARFDDAIDADVAGRDHRLGRAAGRSQRQQLEEDVQLDEVPVELEGVDHLPAAALSDGCGWLSDLWASPSVSRARAACACSAAFRPRLVR